MYTPKELEVVKMGFEYFDELPETLQEMLNNASVKLSAQEIYEYYTVRGLEETIDMLQTALDKLHKLTDGTNLGTLYKPRHD